MAALRYAFGSPSVFGTVEMLRVQRKVLVREPLGCLKVQLAAAGSEQGGVGSLLNKRVSEKEIIAFGQHQCIADKAIADVVRYVDEVPQQSQIKPLADNSCSLKRLPVALPQSVHARKHQTLDGRGDGIFASFFRVV